MTAFSHSLDDSSTESSILACILDDFSGTRDVLRMVRRFVLTGDQPALDSIVHDNDSTLSAPFDSVIEVVPDVWFVCVHIDHVELGQFSSVDMAAYKHIFQPQSYSLSDILHIINCLPYHD
jgi:hypothetical protein